MLRYAIDKQLRLVVVSSSATVNAAQLVALRQQIKDDPDYDSRWPVLVDLGGASALDFSAAELRQLAASAMTDRSARQAIVVGSELGFGLARMFEAFSAVSKDNENVRVFRNADEARSWVLSAPDQS
jgi:hypothetical protein